MNWKITLDENGDPRVEDWSDWAIYDRPRFSLLKLIADDPNTPLEEYEPGRYLENWPDQKNSGP